MLVEDDANDVFFVRHALTTALIRNPVEVFDRAAPTYEYLSRHALAAPALIILDMSLAAGDFGLDVLTWIRQRPAPLGTTPVLMLTGSDREDERDASRRLGAFDFLQKPVTPEALTTAVQALGYAVVNNMTAGQLGIHIVRPQAAAGPADVPPSPTAPAPLQEASRRYTYVRDDDQRRIRVTAMVALDAADLAAIVTRQASEKTWGFDIVYDLRAAKGAATRTDAQQVGDFLRRFVAQHGRRGRVAVVTRDITMLGIAQGYAYDTAAERQRRPDLLGPAGCRRVAERSGLTTVGTRAPRMPSHTMRYGPSAH